MEENNSTSCAMCLSGSNIVSGSVSVEGNSILCVSGETGEYQRFDSKPYQITLYREVM